MGFREWFATPPAPRRDEVPLEHRQAVEPGAEEARRQGFKAGYEAAYEDAAKGEGYDPLPEPSSAPEVDYDRRVSRRVPVGLTVGVRTGPAEVPTYVRCEFQESRVWIDAADLLTLVRTLALTLEAPEPDDDEPHPTPGEREAFEEGAITALMGLDTLVSGLVRTIHDAAVTAYRETQERFARAVRSEPGVLP